MNENEIGKIVVDCAVRLHIELGPGLLETVYEALLSNELELEGLRVIRQVRIPIEYHGMKLSESLRGFVSL